MRAYLQTLPPVKPTRRGIKPAVPFGQGILPSRPHFAVTLTASDADWAAESFNAAPEPDFDAMAAEAEALDRLTAGCLL
jgi:hypothetical protein